MSAALRKGSASTTMALLAAVAVAVLPGPGAGAKPASVPARVGSAQITTYRDTLGDSKGPLDIKLVDIIIQPGNVMRFSVTVPNAPTLNEGQDLGVVFDLDKNKATGSNGSEFYWVVQGRPDKPPLFTAYTWTNGAWQRKFLNSFDGTPWSNGQTVSFSLAELGATSFNFAVYAKQDGTTQAWDWAPSSGQWSFALSSPAPKPKPKPSQRLAFGAVAISPARPTSGLPFYAAPAVKIVSASGSSKGIPSGTVSCRATLRKKVLPVIMHRVSPGKGVVCGWRVPSGSAGAMLYASIGVTSRGLTARKAYHWPAK